MLLMAILVGRIAKHPLGTRNFGVGGALSLGFRVQGLGYKAIRV